MPSQGWNSPRAPASQSRFRILQATSSIFSCGASRDVRSATSTNARSSGRYYEIRSHGIREVVVFHSTVAELAKYEAELPFPLIADPERQLYQRFGVERRPGSLLSGRALRAATAGQTAALAKRSTMRAFGP